MKTVLTSLEYQKQLLSDPARWIKGASAKNKKGDATIAFSTYAVCWCQAGASTKYWGNDIRLLDMENEFKIRTDIAQYLGFTIPVKFNDAKETTHADLMEFYDLCIIQAKNMT